MNENELVRKIFPETAVSFRDGSRFEGLRRVSGFWTVSSSLIRNLEGAF